MSDYIKRIRTTTGDKQIDYNALANLPTLVSVDNTLTESGKAADAKVVGDKLAEVAQNSDAKYANILKGHAKGKVVRVDDVSPIEHTPKVKVQSKNLIPYPFLNSDKTLAGGTFTALADGGISGSGTPTDYCDMYLYEGEPLVKSGVITASLSGTYTNMVVMLAIYDGAGNELIARNCEENPVSINLDEYPTATKWLVLIKRKTSNVTMSGTAYLQIEKGDAATEYAPYVDPSTVTVTRCSKNVVQSEKIANVQWKNAPNYTVNGVTWTASDDREITVQGETPEANYSVYDIATGERFTSWLKDGETYTASINQTGSGSIDLIVDVTDNETGKIVTYIRDGVTFTVDKTKYTYGTFRLQINPSTVVNAVVKPQIELGQVATAFEPHNGKTYNPNADGTVTVEHLYPTMTVFANTDNTTVECEYNQDTNAVIKKLTDAIVALGGTV